MLAEITPYYLLRVYCSAQLKEGYNMDNGRTENKESAKIIAISTVMSMIGSALLLAVSHVIG